MTSTQRNRGPKRAPKSAPQPADQQAAKLAGQHAARQDVEQATNQAPEPASHPAGPGTVGRIPVLQVTPCVENGAFPAKSVVDEPFEVTATVFREGHDGVNATVVLTDPDGGEQHVAMTLITPGLDHWSATISANRTGKWSYRVEGWSNPYSTWAHDAAIKIAAGVDAELMLEEGALVLQRALSEVDRTPAHARSIMAAIAALRDQSRPAQARLQAAIAPDVRSEMDRAPLRDLVSPGRSHDWLVERERALYGAWYEIFARSEGATQDPDTGLWTSGTLATAARRLTAIADMGFDVVYLTPIHPIGAVNRKGPNNTPKAGPRDPGSPYAIGSVDGGHDAIAPELGTWADFDAFVAQARRLGLEVALDLALNCAPDHPWVAAHPEWFTQRADGTIACAENPPKKYEDVYPLNFDNDPAGIYAEVRRVVQVWIDHGVTIIRVDNPHTKPLQFWQWLIADVATVAPGIIWLAEAFTKPAMMHTLGKIGFQQSYTYYTWRIQKWELEEYVTELAGEAATYMRPSFWPTTHDILPPYLQYGGPTAWKIRAALAATLVPTYGIYSGYELMEDVARPGVEEQIDNEKYQLKDRHWSDYEPGGPKAGQSLAPYLKGLNEIRRAHPSLHWLRNLHLHHADDAFVMAFSKRRKIEGREDVMLVVANLDPHATRETKVHLDMPALGLDPGEKFVAHDLITGASWHWGEHNFVRLGPDGEPVHIIHIRRF
jgi:starch synthase (maltosyl-transferring)